MLCKNRVEFLQVVKLSLALCTSLKVSFEILAILCAQLIIEHELESVFIMLVIHLLYSLSRLRRTLSIMKVFQLLAHALCRCEEIFLYRSF